MWLDATGKVIDYHYKLVKMFVQRKKMWSINVSLPKMIVLNWAKLVLGGVTCPQHLMSSSYWLSQLKKQFIPVRTDLKLWFLRRSISPFIPFPRKVLKRAEWCDNSPTSVLMNEPCAVLRGADISDFMALKFVRTPFFDPCLEMWNLKRSGHVITGWKEWGLEERRAKRHHMQSGDTHPITDDVLLDVMHCRGRKLLLKWVTGKSRRRCRRLETCSYQAAERQNDRTTERVSCSMHGVPERRSNERGGWGGVTPCVVSPPHRLPTKRATFTPKYDRLLAPWGCHGERHQRPVRLEFFFSLFWELYVDTSMRWHFHVLCKISATFQ